MATTTSSWILMAAAGLLVLASAIPADARWSERARGDSASASERASNARVTIELACSADTDLVIRLSGSDAPQIAESGKLGPTPMEVNTRRGVNVFEVRFLPTDDPQVVAVASPGPEFIRAISDGSSLTIRGLARERLARFSLSGINRVMRTLRSRCGPDRVEAQPAASAS